MRENAIKIIPEVVELSIIYDFEEPILKEDLLELLKNKGFDVFTESSAEFKRVEILNVSPLEITIARKRGCNVNYNRKIGLITVSGNKFKEVYLAFNEVKSILSEKNLLAGVNRYELNTRVKVQINKWHSSTLQLIAQAFNGLYLPKDKISKFNKIFDKELQPFCIRLFPKDSEKYIGDLRKKSSWLDVYIFPYIPNTKYLAVWIVFRDKNPEKIVNFASDAEKKIRDAIKVVVDDGI